MHKDPIYFYFIVPTLLLLLQIMVVIVFGRLVKVLKYLFRVKDSDIKKYIIPARKDKQTELLKQGDKDGRNSRINS